MRCDCWLVGTPEYLSLSAVRRIGNFPATTYQQAVETPAGLNGVLIIFLLSSAAPCFDDETQVEEAYFYTEWK